MKVNNKKIFDDATMTKAVELIQGGEFTLTEICKKLHTSLAVLNRNMDWYYRHLKDNEDGETDWKTIFRTKRSIVKKKGDTRIVYECQSCGYERSWKLIRCLKCNSYSIIKQELRNKVSSAELKTIAMTGRKWSEASKMTTTI